MAGVGRGPGASRRVDDADAIRLAREGRLDAAIAAHAAAIAASPADPALHLNFGVTLQTARQYERAAEAFRRAVALAPGYALALCNLGTALNRLGRPAEGADACRAAIAADPTMALAHAALADSLMALDRVDEALSVLRRAVELSPADAALLQLYCSKRLAACDWPGLEDVLARLRSLVPLAGGALRPFEALMMVDAAGQLAVSTAWGRGFAVAASPPEPRRPRAVGRQIRLGYLSADFQLHATAALMAELFERHDRSRFEVIAYSYGADDGSDMRRRLVRAFDRFVDVSAMSDVEAADRIREDGVDILVDLKGFIQNARTGIVGRRPAAVQVNYLGFPGTMGPGLVDYVVADPFVAPFDRADLFGEAIVHLPDTYQPNDRLRAIAGTTPTRAQCGLPDAGFVFCCFNHAYKITPDVFAIWMRILAAVPGSVLWLLAGEATVVANLRREASAAGIAPDRLVFAGRAAPADHLARHRLADLFLDTLPINAHTTASDALWVGLPVVTCVGDAFAGRVAGSLLRAAGLADLVAETPAEYEASALALAGDAGRLADIRRRLAAERGRLPLFDIDRYAHHLEAAYATMWERNRAGLPPEAFAVAPLPADLPAPARQPFHVVCVASDAAVAEATGLLAAGRAADAAASLENVLGRDPAHFGARLQLAAADLRLGRAARACLLLGEAVALRPADPRARTGLCAALRAAGRSDEAVAAGRLAVELAPSGAEAHHLLGLALLDAGESAAGIDALAAALRLRPGLVEARIRLVEALQAEDRLAEALAVLQAAV